MKKRGIALIALFLLVNQLGILAQDIIGTVLQQKDAAIQQQQNQQQIVLQNKQLMEAIKTLRELKQIYDTGKKTYNEIKGLKEDYDKIEERLHQFEDVKSLKINDIENILDRILCVRDKNYFFTSGAFRNLVNRIQGSFSTCDNEIIFNISYPGFSSELQQNSKYKKISANTYEKDLKSLDQKMVTAMRLNDVLENADSKTKMNIGFMYKQLADELIKLGKDLHDNLQSDNVEINKAERMDMLARSIDYQLKALDYQRLSSQLLKESSTPSRSDAREIKSYQRSLMAVRWAGYRK